MAKDHSQQHKVDPYYKWNFFLFIVLGTINNFAYSVVLGAAKSIAKAFGAEKETGLIPWANVGIGFIARSTNILLEHTSYTSRVIANGGLLAVGTLMVAISREISFTFALLGILVVGASSSFGESLFLGFMRKFDPRIVSGWSQGTGWAGVFGAGFYFVLAYLKLSDATIFKAIAPFAFIYILSYFSIKVPKKKTHDPGHSSDDELSIPEAEGAAQEEPLEDTSPLLGATRRKRGLLDRLIGSSNPEETPIMRFKRVHKLIFYRASQLSLVYFFEYVVSVGCSEMAEPKEYDLSPRFTHSHAYVILSLCYQIGVLISRSSLSVVKIKRIGVLTILQGINLIIWQIQDVTKFMGLYVQFAAMIYVGLLGGAMYVNVFYLILNDPQFPQDDRELAVNITTLYITLGISLAAVFQLLMQNTWLRDFVN